jgi:hypothetical protein
MGQSKKILMEFNLEFLHIFFFVFSLKLSFFFPSFPDSFLLDEEVGYFFKTERKEIIIFISSTSRFFDQFIYRSFNLLFIKKRINSIKTQSQVNFSKGFVICVLVLLVASFALSFWFKIKPTVRKLFRTKRKVTIF